jgi:alpha-L-fucosidase 2
VLFLGLAPVTLHAAAAQPPSSLVARRSYVPTETTVWFDAPARHFTESCPLGNGALGAMIFGGVDEERIVLNESGMWSGSREQADRPDGADHLPEIRRLLLEGKNVEAEDLVNKSFTCLGKGTGFGVGSKVPFGC